MTRPIGAAVGDAAAAGRQPPEPHNTAQHFCACSTSDPSLFTPSALHASPTASAIVIDSFSRLALEARHHLGERRGEVAWTGVPCSATGGRTPRMPKAR